MTKHSKNNTAAATFTYAEYKKLDYGTKRQRLEQDSLKNFDVCSLCLKTAVDPLCWYDVSEFIGEDITDELVIVQMATSRARNVSITTSCHRRSSLTRN